MEIHVGKILKDRKGIVFRMVSFGHTYIEYFLDNYDEVRPLSSKIGHIKTKQEQTLSI